MKKLILLFCFITLNVALVSGKTWIVKNTSNFTFDPSTITINLDDTINFQLASIHSALEVSLDTYNANGNTPLTGGFHVPFGGGKLSGISVGTHYYVCQNHYAMGMKGIIIVQATGINELGIRNKELGINVFPNPISSSNFIINYSIYDKSNIEIKLFDLTGKEIDNLLSEEKEKGNYNLNVDNKYQPGLYLIRLSDNNSSIARKVVIY